MPAEIGESTKPRAERGAPQRTCVGCRTRRAQDHLVRCVLLPDGAAEVSRTAAGRGAWVCAGSTRCLSQGIRRGGFQKAWRRDASPAALDALRQAFEQLVDNMRDLPVADVAAGRPPEKG